VSVRPSVCPSVVHSLPRLWFTRNRKARETTNLAETHNPGQNYYDSYNFITRMIFSDAYWLYICFYYCILCCECSSVPYCYRGNAVCHCFNKPLSIYLSITGTASWKSKGQRSKSLSRSFLKSRSFASNEDENDPRPYIVEYNTFHIVVYHSSTSIYIPKLR